MTYVSAGGGYIASPSTNPKRAGLQANFNVGAVGDGSFGAGPAVRMKFTPNVQEGAIAFEAIAVGYEWVVSPLVRAGLHVLQFATIDDSFAFGMFSPYLEAGFMMILPHGESMAGPFVISLVGTAEVALRFTGQSVEFYGGAILALGYGVASWKQW